MTTNIPTNRGQFERKGDDPNQEGLSIQAQSFGGLNTVSNPLSIPYEDSPAMLNTTIGVSGSVQKREGTQSLGSYNGAIIGVTLVPVTTGLGYAYQVLKRGIDIDVFELTNTASSLLRMTKTNVWSAGVSNVKATYTTTNEAESRVIFCTGGNVPVQLRFTERRSLVVATAAQTVFVFANADKHQTTTPSNTLIYVDGVLRSATYSYDVPSKNLTVTITGGVVAGNRVIDLVLITWQWWAESVFFFGDRFWDTVIRFHDKLSDRHIAIPSNLRDSIDPRLDFPNLFPITALSFLQPSFSFIPIFSDRRPLGWQNYAFSDGSAGASPVAQLNVVATALQTVFDIPTTNLGFVGAAVANTSVLYNGLPRACTTIVYNGSTTLTVTFTVGVPAVQANVLATFNPNPVVPSPFFVTFGSIDTTKTGREETVYLSRERLLPFNGGNGIIGNNLYVQRDNVVQSLNTGAGGAYGDYRMYNKNTSYVQLTNGTTIGHVIDFTGGDEAGVPANARIRITNREVGLYVGTSATNVPTARTDGSWVSCYGLGDYANYATGSFPKNVTLFQNRLCFSGFPQNPLLVCMSSQLDTTIPGEYYASFQQDVFTILPTDPLDILVSGQAEDYITGIAEYQGSLFTFTRRAVYRVSTTGRGTVTADNVSVLSVASTGLANAQSLTTANDTLMFLSDDGVYALVNGASSQESTEYRLEEMSTKIRNRFNVTSVNRNYCWMAYDLVDDSLMVALFRKGDTQFASSIHVFSMFRQAWTEYDTPGGFNSFTASTVQTVTNVNAFMMIVSRTTSVANQPLDTTLLQMHRQRALDFVSIATGTGSSQTVTIQPRPITTHTITTGIQDYLVSWRMLPLLDVQDTHVTVNGVELVFGVGYIKVGSNSIRLIGFQVSGLSLVISYRRPDTDYDGGKVRYNTTVPLNLSHAAVYVDNASVFEPTQFTVSDAGVVTITAPNLSRIEVGSVYGTYFMTPLFTWATLKAYKRLLYWLGFFDNTLALETYVLADVNVPAGQVAEQIVGMPKMRLDCNISFVYNSHDTGDTSADVYGFQSLVWDASLFDVFLPQQSDDYVLVKSALQGMGYSFQGVVWSTDESSFRLCGYSLDGKVKGNKYNHWSS